MFSIFAGPRLGQEVELPLDKNLPLADDSHVLPALRIRANLVADSPPR
jgi:hypothetical protein